MVDKALVHFAISRLDRGTVVIHVLPAGFCQDDVIPKVSHLRSASKVLNACTYCSNSFISLFSFGSRECRQQCQLSGSCSG